MTRTWVFGLTSILLTIILVGYTIHLQKEIVLQDAYRTTSNLADSIEKDLGESLAGIDKAFLELETRLAPLRDGGKVDQPEIRRFIDQKTLENPYLLAVLVLDERGRILHWNNNFQKIDVSGRNYFKIHRDSPMDGLYIGPPQLSMVNQGQWIAGVSKAVRYDGRQLSLVLASIVDLKRFNRHFMSAALPSDAVLTVASTDGYVYVRIPTDLRTLGSRLAQQDWEVPRHDNARTMIVNRKLAEYPLQFSLARDKQALLAPWQETALNFTMLGVALCTVFLFLTWRTTLYQKRQLRVREELERQAITDPLTRLANRRHLLEQAKLEIKKADRSAAPLSVVLIDLDHFKQVNDRYGHQVGDEVLVGTADIIRHCCRETDILSRFGGEEFLLLLPGTDMPGALASAGKIRDRLAQKFYSHAGGEFHVTASFGVAQWVSDEADINAALKRADQALYKVKGSGRNHVRCMPEDVGYDAMAWLAGESD